MKKFPNASRKLYLTLVLPGFLLVMASSAYSLLHKQAILGGQTAASKVTTTGFILSAIGNLVMVIYNDRRAKQLKKLQGNNFSA